MRRRVLWALITGLFGQALFATTVGVYYDRADWEAAMSLHGVRPLASISFADSQWTSSLQAFPQYISMVSESSAGDGMDVSINSTCGGPGECPTPGHVSNDMWVDTLAKYSSTNFLFTNGIYGFGGDFDITGGNGLFIGPAGEVPYPYYTGEDPFFVNPSYHGFIGVISDQLLTDIFISWGDNGSCLRCFSNSYTLSNLEVATLPTPEPNFGYAFAIFSGLAICCGLSKRLNSLE